MNGKPAQHQVIGTVLRVNSSGIGPNSGEITLVIAPPNSTDVLLVSAGIMDNNHSPNGIEHGVYASCMTMALAALTKGRKLQVNFVIADKPRIYGMTILA